MALQNLQQYGCQTGNKLKEKSRDLNRNSNRIFFLTKMKQCSVADTKTLRSLEFWVVLFLSLIFCKQEKKLLFFRERFRLHLPHIKTITVFCIGQYEFLWTLEINIHLSLKASVNIVFMVHKNSYVDFEYQNKTTSDRSTHKG